MDLNQLDSDGRVHLLIIREHALQRTELPDRPSTEESRLGRKGELVAGLI